MPAGQPCLYSVGRARNFFPSGGGKNFQKGPPVPDPLGVAILGCGTVGGAVVGLMVRESDRLAARAGRALSLRHVVVRDVNRARPGIPAGLLTNDLEKALADPAVAVVAELAGGVPAPALEAAARGDSAGMEATSGDGDDASEHVYAARH